MLELKNIKRKIRLEDVCSFVKNKGRISDFYRQDYISTENMLPNRSGISRVHEIPNTGMGVAFETGDILVSNIRPYFKKIWYAKFSGRCSNDVLVFRARPNIDSRFLYYVLSDDHFFDYSMSTSKGTKMPRGDKIAIMKYQVPELDLATQKKIAAILLSLDDKIDLNNKINENLEQQAQAMFKSWFIDRLNLKRKIVKAEEFFDISIGKTPPRTETQWFNKNSEGVVWVSISDMKNCGIYISSSSERLVSSAVSKYNVKIVPDNTVILSFKLTVGRVAITDGSMTTNEAIAHFITHKKKIVEYLHCYLKNFNFQIMGSTSSIATAVNSKIIKAMQFTIPEEEELNRFYDIVHPIFSKIKNNQRENIYLAQLRDTLLPKLMRGEIDVSKVDISKQSS